jgi:hypothetical protein
VDRHTVFEVESLRSNLVETPSSDFETPVEDARKKRKEAKRSLLVVPERKPHTFMTAENSLFLAFLSSSDVDIFHILQECDWERIEPLRPLALAICQQLRNRVGCCPNTRNRDRGGTVE